MVDIYESYRSANSEAEAGNFRNAALLYQRIAQSEMPLTERAPFHLLAADAFLEAGSSDEALVECQTAISHVPNAIAYRLLGRILMEADRPVEAEQALRRSLQLDTTPTACLYLGILLSDTDPTEAEGILRQAISLDPRFDEAHFQLGVFLIRQERFDDAIESLRVAASYDPDYALEIREIGYRLVSEKRFADAIKYLGTYLSLKPNDISTFELLQEVSTAHS